jgi:hypothetical protein
MRIVAWGGDVTAQEEQVMRKGKYIMLVRNEESDNDDQTHLVVTYISMTEVNNLSRPQYNISFERQIERLWAQSRQLGRSYNDFVVHFLEVLLILQRRDSVKLAAPPARRVAA